MVWRNGQYEPETPIKVSAAVNVLGLTIGQIVKGQQGDNRRLRPRRPHPGLRRSRQGGVEERREIRREHPALPRRHRRSGQTEGPIYLPMRLMALKPDKDGKIPGPCHPELRHRRRQTRRRSAVSPRRRSSVSRGTGWGCTRVENPQDDGLHPRLCLGDFDNDGEMEMVCAVVLDEGRVITTTPKSTLIALKFAR